MNRICIETNLLALWNAYSGKRGNRFPCDITLRNGQTATHIYCGYGKIRLEKVAAWELKSGKKGFLGDSIKEAEYKYAKDCQLWIED